MDAKQILESGFKISEKLLKILTALLLAFYDETKTSLHGEKSVAAWIAAGKDSSTLFYDTEAESLAVREKLAKNHVPYLALTNELGQSFVVIRNKDFDRVREIADKDFQTVDTQKHLRDKEKTH